ncbi:MAG: acetyl-CoA acetyltransferase [Solirubrobacterales bacterium]|nr:acetyl-CoA acetyltransferase [Solirubrobacterales bacterium]
MSPGIEAGIVGVGETPFKTRRTDVNYPELVQRATLDALAMAEMTMDDIDAVVYAMAPTEFAGVSDIDKWVVGAIGAANKPWMRVHLGGATGGAAAAAGHLHVRSGLYENVLVVGGDKVAETPDAQFILNLIWDPFFERGMGLNTITMAALQTVRHMDRYGTTTAQLDQVSQRAWRRALRNPNAHLKGDLPIEQVRDAPVVSWPLRRYDCCPRSTGAAAVVMSSERVIDERKLPAAWIAGSGASGNTVFIGDRAIPKTENEYADWPELRVAAEHAYRQAGITDPASEIDVVECYAPFSINEISGVEALGLREPGEGGPAIERGEFDPGGDVEFNPSGGTLCANPIAVTGLVRTCDAALQILDRAGDFQVHDARRAVCTAVGGSFQFQTCMVLDRERPKGNS